MHGSEGGAASQKIPIPMACSRAPHCAICGLLTPHGHPSHQKRKLANGGTSSRQHQSRHGSRTPRGSQNGRTSHETEKEKWSIRVMLSLNGVKCCRRIIRFGDRPIPIMPIFSTTGCQKFPSQHFVARTEKGKDGSPTWGHPSRIKHCDAELQPVDFSRSPGQMFRGVRNAGFYYVTVRLIKRK